MSRIAYVNGRYVRHAEAAVHVEDRGYQFADGVYEVCEIKKSAVIDMPGHMNRLVRSLKELQIAMPTTRQAMEMIIKEVTRRNKIVNGIVYLQVTRGVARRDHVFPGAGVRPALVITAKSIDPGIGDKKAEKGIGVITVPDNRWERVDIKSVSLLPNVLARQKAKEAGAGEAWFVDTDGNVTEGGATNAWIVTKDGELVTRPAEAGILRGITRTTALKVAEKLGYSVTERKFSVEEALDAKEAFITAASTIVMPVVTIDGQPVGNGHPGEMATELRSHYHEVADKDAL